MDKKEKLSDILNSFGPVIKEEPIQKLTAEEYVVMKLQEANNDINRSSALLSKERENNVFLHNKNDLLVKILDFIFENFEFTLTNNHTLYSNYCHAEVTDQAIENVIKKLIEKYKEEQK